MKKITQQTTSCPISVVMSDMEAQEHYDEFFEEIFSELEDKVSWGHLFWVLCSSRQQFVSQCHNI